MTRKRPTVPMPITFEEGDPDPDFSAPALASSSGLTSAEITTPEREGGILDPLRMAPSGSRGTSNHR